MIERQASIEINKAAGGGLIGILQTEIETNTNKIREKQSRRWTGGLIGRQGMRLTQNKTKWVVDWWWIV